MIVIDDGSFDETVLRSREFTGRLNSLRIIESKPNKGKGYVLRKAMLEAQGEYILFMDADNSTSIKELDKFFPVINERSSIYISSRRMVESRVKVPFARRALGVIYILIARMILGLKVSDINCGFKVYSRSAARDVFARQIMDDWSFDAEDLFIAEKHGHKILEIPVEWQHKYTSKVKPFRDGINSFLSLAKIRVNDLFEKYN